MFTVKNAEGKGTAEDPYTWTLENVPDKTEVIFTESGYEVSGYEVTINQKATTDAEAGIVKATVVDKETVGAEFTNEYRQKLGNVQVTKVFSGIGELPESFQITNNITARNRS